MKRTRRSGRFPIILDSPSALTIRLFEHLGRHHRRKAWSSHPREGSSPDDRVSLKCLSRLFDGPVRDLAGVGLTDDPVWQRIARDGEDVLEACGRVASEQSP